MALEPGPKDVPVLQTAASTVTRETRGAVVHIYRLMQGTYCSLGGGAEQTVAREKGRKEKGHGQTHLCPQAAWQPLSLGQFLQGAGWMLVGAGRI